MKKKRLLAWLMTLVMMFGLMPATALAEDDQSTGEAVTEDEGLNPDDLYYTFAGVPVDSEDDADIILSKTADPKGNGEYEVTLKVNVKEGEIEPKPTEVVFCLDASTSMRLCANECGEKHSAQDGSCTVTQDNRGNIHYAHEKSRWSIAVDAIEEMSGNLVEAGIPASSIKYVYFHGSKSSGYANTSTNAYDGLAATLDNDWPTIHYTHLSNGVVAAMGQFSDDASTNKVLIIVADGNSDDGYSPAGFSSWASQTNNAAYGVGFAFSSDNFKNMVGAGNYYTADDVDELDVVLEEIQEKVVGMINDPMGSMVYLDTEAEDIVKTSGQPDATLDGSTINWTNADGLEDEVELKYTVSIKNTNKVAGEYLVPLNGNAVLNYSYDGGNYSVAFPIPEATVRGATLDVAYKFDGSTIKTEDEWIDLSTEDEFETEIPVVGEKVTINREVYTVTGVTGAPEDELEAEAYEVVVTLSQGALISDKFVVTEEPTLEEGVTVPDDVVYASEDGEVDLPENESVKVLFGISVENGLYEAAEDIVVLDSNATYIGYKNNVGTADVQPNEALNGATVDLDEDEKVTLYFVMEVSADDADDDGVVENIATVNGEEVSEEITIFDKGNVLSIDKVRVDVNTENVPDSFADLDDVNYAVNPKVNYADGEVTLLYKVTVTNTVATYNLKGLQYTVKDSGATYVGYDKEDDVLAPESPVAPSTEDVTGYLKFGQSIDLYFTRTFEVEASGNVTNIAELYMDGEEVDSDPATTAVTVNVTYTLNYDANADEDTVTNMPAADTGESNTGSYTFTVSDAVPVREGYTFQGWATTADATIANAATVTVTDPATSATVYAVWKPNDLAITFDSNAGVLAPYVTGEMDDQTVQYNVAEALNANQFELGGYRFNGWNTQANGEGTPYADGADIQVTSNTRLYAQWSVITPDRVTLTYHVNYEGYTGTIKEVEDTYNVGEIGMVRNAATFTAPEGKRFVAWNTKADGTGTSYDPTNLMTNNIQVFENTDLYAIWRDLQRDIEVTKTSNVTTARRDTWVEYTITVTNTGEMKLDGVVVTETPDATVFSEGEFVNLPDGVNFVEDSNDKVKITELGVDGTVTLTYKAKVKSDAQNNATLKNTVEAKVPAGPGAKDELEQGTVYVPSSGGGGGNRKPKPEIVAGDVEEILNTEDHFQYVQGYPDGTVGPERNITRAEATVIFFRLLQDHVRAGLLTAENEFPDVKLDDWFNLGVSTMEAGGFVSGYEDGYFRPNGYITRAELATIISNFDDLEPAAENKFADVEGHWAEKYVNSAAAKGWISGYDDGLFRPNQYITRAETMSMINRVLNRKVDEAGLHADAKQWKDNVKGQWYYYAVLEATNHHDYQRADVKDAETWTAINPNKVWEN